jgi:hypothetical protein
VDEASCLVFLDTSREATGHLGFRPKSRRPDEADFATFT